MKLRNPLFVAGFPYTCWFIGYIVLNVIGGITDDSTDDFGTGMVIALIIALLVVIVSGFYSLYWLIDTARVLRRETGERIPLAILLVIPLANYWWMWRYGSAAEKYTSGKVQGVLGFILLALLGPIGMGILQDSYNKHSHLPDQNQPTLA